MKTLNFLSTVKSDENVGIKVNSELVKKVQDYLLPNSNSINLTIQEKDNLLGVKYYSSVAITKRYLGLRQEEILQTYDCLSF